MTDRSTTSQRTNQTAIQRASQRPATHRRRRRRLSSSIESATLRTFVVSQRQGGQPESRPAVVGQVARFTAKPQAVCEHILCPRLPRVGGSTAHGRKEGRKEGTEDGRTDGPTQGVRSRVTTPSEKERDHRAPSCVGGSGGGAGEAPEAAVRARDPNRDSGRIEFCASDRPLLALARSLARSSPMGENAVVIVVNVVVGD